jgi:DNA-binding MarR family transcriptional regulator
MKRKAPKLKKMDVQPFLPSIAAMRVHPAMAKYRGYCFFKSAVTLKARFDERFQKLGLVGPQFGMLIIVKEEGTITQNELGSYMAIDKATMVRFIDHLEEMKLVVRTQSKEDRRANLIQITKAGEQMIVKLDEERRSCEEEFFAPLSKAERDQLAALVHKLTTSQKK